MFEALAEAGINIKMITTSEIKISVLVDRASAVAALRAVHKAFQLDEVHARPQPAFSPASSTTRAMKLVPLADPEAAEPREQGMEDLVIAGVELDETQGRITLFDVPDRPGYAARVFRAIAEAGVFVDMIVQNVEPRRATRILSFTVPRDVGRPGRRRGAADRGRADRRSSRRWPSSRSSAWACGPTPASPPACSAPWPTAAININLINTSEIRINVGTDVAKGREGLDCLKKAFALNGEG